MRSVVCVFGDDCVDGEGNHDGEDCDGDEESRLAGLSFLFDEHNVEDAGQEEAVRSRTNRAHCVEDNRDVLD